jgi:hypothetical protein
VVLVAVRHILEQNAEKHFFRLFRMDHRTFQHVLARTKHGIQRDYLQSERGDGFVSPEAQVAFTIRWLAVSFGLFLSSLFPTVLLSVSVRCVCVYLALPVCMHSLSPSRVGFNVSCNSWQLLASVFYLSTEEDLTILTICESHA